MFKNLVRGMEKMGKIKFHTIGGDISLVSRSLNKEERGKSKKIHDKIFNEVVDLIIERNIGAYKKLKDL